MTVSAAAASTVFSAGLVVARRAEVQADEMGGAHAQGAVGFGGEAGADLGGVGLAGVVEGGITRAAAPLALGVGAGGEVFFNDLAQEV